MFSFIHVFFLSVFISVALNVSADFLEDYCWRDFDDVIPSDALIAGKARDGTPIYIGQVLYDNKLIPGKIHHNSSQIHIEFKTVHVLNETIKILCTQHPEKFIWVPTRTLEILHIENKHIFEGGYEKGVLTYVGRATSFGELTVGKVICWTNSHCIDLTTIENGKWHNYNSFEILTFDDTVPPITTATPVTEEPTTTEVPTTNQPTESDITNTNSDNSNNSDKNNTSKNHNEKYKKDSYTSETPQKASALAIFLLVASVSVIAGAIIFLVRRC